MTPYYEDDTVTIYHADCREMPDDFRATATIFSPPYNVGIDYDEHDDTMAWGDYIDLAEQVCGLIHEVQPHGRTWINVTPVVPEFPLPAGDHSGRSSNARRSLIGIWTMALENNWHNIWDYVAWTTPGRGPGCAWGSWESPSGPNMRGEWETIIAAYTGPTWQRDTPERFHLTKDKQGGWIDLTSNVWRLRPDPRGPGTGGHPAPFPVRLAERCIRLSTWPGETVLDPFMGTGATLRAAKDLGRKAIGIELSERYCEIAARRLAQEVLAL